MKSLLLAIVGLVFMSMQSYAQNVAAPTGGAASSETANSDYVTIGSRVPYFTAPDATIQTMTTLGTMKASIFKWTATTAAGVAMPLVPFFEYDGTAGIQYDNFRAIMPATGYYDNEVSVVWSVANGFTAGTAYKVKVAEKAVTLSTTIAGCEDASTEDKDVFVLARPTVAIVGTEGGGCSTAPLSSFEVPLNVTGLGDWDVIYTVAYNGGAASAPATYRLTLAAPAVTDLTVIAASTAPRITAATEGLVFSLGAGYGYYDVAITDISDRTSRKSLAALTALGAATTYRVYVNPVPTTQPIQHIKNL